MKQLMQLVAVVVWGGQGPIPSFAEKPANKIGNFPMSFGGQTHIFRGSAMQFVGGCQADVVRSATCDRSQFHVIEMSCKATLARPQAARVSLSNLPMDLHWGPNHSLKLGSCFLRQKPTEKMREAFDAFDPEREGECGA